MNQEQLNAIATTILNAEDNIAAGQLAVEEIIALDNNPTTIHSRLQRLRQTLIKIGQITVEESKQIVHRDKDEIERFKKQQLINLNQKEKLGVNRLPQFRNPRTLKQRIDIMNVDKLPTTGDLIDIIVLFCARPSEIQTLTLHPENKTISGFSKNKSGDPNQQREFISIYGDKLKEMKFLQLLLQWIQKTDFSALFESSNQRLTKYLKENYSEDITLKTLRRFGVDLIIQKYRPRNPQQQQELIQKATRHQPVINAEMSYGTVNQTKLKAIKRKTKSVEKQSILQEHKFPQYILGFKVCLVGKSHVAKKKINGKVVSITLDRYYPELEQRIKDFCAERNINFQQQIN